MMRNTCPQEENKQRHNRALALIISRELVDKSQPQSMTRSATALYISGVFVQNHSRIRC
jgi:hypothetical protein